MNRVCRAGMIVPVLLAGCMKEWDVEVLSEPPGARIEVDNDYVGNSPLTIAIPGTFDRGVSEFDHHVIRAIPNGPGYVQTKILWGNKKLPKRIFFNTNLGPPHRPLDVDVTLRRE